MQKAAADARVREVFLLAAAVALPAALVLTAPFALAGSPFAVKAFFWVLGCAAWMGLAILAAILANTKLHFLGAYVILAGLAMLFTFVPPAEWWHLRHFAYGAYAGFMLSSILVSGRVNRLPAF